MTRAPAPAAPPPWPEADVPPRAGTAPMPPDAVPGAPPAFDAAFRHRLHQLLVWRRDVRRFRRDPLPPGTLERLVRAACLAPSVGLCEPWRFVRVEDPARRARVRASFERSNAAALAAQDGGRAPAYARLRLAGLDDAPVHLAAFCDPGTAQGGGLGRHSMPEAAAYSVAGAITLLWLAARAEGIGVGWVSILDPLEVRLALDVPDTWQLTGYLCLGHPQAEHDAPELERLGWERRTATLPLLLR